jgi:hypothetical protein
MCFLITAIILTFREFAGENEEWQAAKTKIQENSRTRNSAAIPFARRLSGTRQAGRLPPHPQRPTV